jgi:plastocyanin
MSPSSATSLATALLLLSGTAAAARTIKVTATADDRFDPESFSADKGDTIAFHFGAGNHSVAAGNFRIPCTPADDGGWFSGFFEVDGDDDDEESVSCTLGVRHFLFLQRVEGNERSPANAASPPQDDVFTVKINTTDPIVFYSTQGLECAGGMAGVVNPGSGNETLAAYRARAEGIAMAVSPRRPYGGERVPAEDVADVEESPEKSGAGSGGDSEDSGALSLARAGLGWMVGLAAFVAFAL